MSAVLAWCLAHPYFAFAGWILGFAWVADFLPENRKDRPHD
jgi:hypothetical protein